MANSKVPHPNNHDHRHHTCVHQCLVYMDIYQLNDHIDKMLNHMDHSYMGNIPHLDYPRNLFDIHYIDVRRNHCDKHIVHRTVNKKHKSVTNVQTKEEKK